MVGDVERAGERVLTTLMSYTLGTGSEPAATFDLARKVHPRVVSMAMTAADKLIEQGRLEGRREGGLEGQRAMLVRQLEHRFGPLAGDALARVQAAGPDDLGRWAERLLDVATIDDVLAS